MRADSANGGKPSCFSMKHGSVQSLADGSPADTPKATSNPQKDALDAKAAEMKAELLKRLRNSMPMEARETCNAQRLAYIQLALGQLKCSDCLVQLLQELNTALDKIATSTSPNLESNPDDASLDDSARGAKSPTAPWPIPVGASTRVTRTEFSSSAATRQFKVSVLSTSECEGGCASPSRLNLFDSTSSRLNLFDSMNSTSSTHTTSMGSPARNMFADASPVDTTLESFGRNHADPMGTVDDWLIKAVGGKAKGSRSDSEESSSGSHNLSRSQEEQQTCKPSPIVPKKIARANSLTTLVEEFDDSRFSSRSVSRQGSSTGASSTERIWLGHLTWDYLHTMLAPVCAHGGSVDGGGTRPRRDSWMTTMAGPMVKSIDSTIGYESPGSPLGFRAPKKVIVRRGGVLTTKKLPRSASLEKFSTSMWKTWSSEPDHSRQFEPDLMSQTWTEDPSHPSRAFKHYDAVARKEATMDDSSSDRKIDFIKKVLKQNEARATRVTLPGPAT